MNRIRAAVTYLCFITSINKNYTLTSSLILFSLHTPLWPRGLFGNLHSHAECPRLKAFVLELLCLRYSCPGGFHSSPPHLQVILKEYLHESFSNHPVGNCHLMPTWSLSPLQTTSFFLCHVIIIIIFVHWLFDCFHQTLSSRKTEIFVCSLPCCISSS